MSRFFHWCRRKISRVWEGSVLRQVGVLVCFASLLWLGGAFVAWAFGLPTQLGGDEKAASLDPLWWSLVHVTDPGYLSGHEQATARIVALILTLGGWVLLGGFLISLVTNGFEKRIRRVREGLIRHRFHANHGVILGWDQSGPATVEFLLNDGCQEIVVFSRTPAESIRNHLIANPPNNLPANLKKIYILFGEFDAKNELSRLAPHRAKRIVILGDDVVGRDSRNLKAAMQIAKIARESGLTPADPPICHVGISSLCSFDLLQEVDLPPTDREFMDFRTFNYCEQWARRLWGTLGQFNLQDGEKPYPSLAHQGAITEDDERNVLVAVIGFGEMGQAVAAQAARLGHYANTAPEGKTETEIFVFDPDVENRKEAFLGHCHLEKDDKVPENDQYILPGVRFEFIGESSMSKAACKRLKHWANDPTKIMTVVVCASDPDEAMVAALSLPTEILMATIPILVWQESATGLDELAARLKAQSSPLKAKESKKEDEKQGDEKKQEEKKDTRWEDIHFFGRLDRCIVDDDLLEDVAHASHAAYCGHSITKSGWPKVKKASQREWNGAGEGFRWSNRYQADSFRERLAGMGYTLVASGKGNEDKNALEEFPPEQLETMAIQEHNRWWIERVLAGWTKGKKDKLHLKSECMVAFDELSPEDVENRKTIQDYDRNAMRAMIPHLRKVASLAIVPTKPE